MDNAISSDLIRGHIDTIILRTLFDKDNFTNEICEEIEKKSDKKYEMKQATLYSSLKRLETLKYVSSFWRDTEDGGRRKCYHLTDSGKKFAQKNLNDWNYSRAIIDRLILDADSLPTAGNGSALTSSSPLFSASAVNTNGANTAVKTGSEKLDFETFNDKKFTEVFIKKESVTETTDNSQQQGRGGNVREEEKKESQEPAKCSVNLEEINFRQILNGLIRESAFEKAAEETAVLSEEESQPVSDKIVLEPFNLKINDESFRVKNNYVGKSDYSDVLDKAKQEGFRVRISAPANEKKKGSVYINKVRFVSGLVLFMALILELLYVSLRYNAQLGLKTEIYILTVLIMAVFPTALTVNYFVAPEKCTSKSYNAKNHVMTTAIIVFNALLVCVAVIVLLNVNLKEVLLYVAGLLAPIFVCADILLYVSVKSYLFSREKYKIK